MPMLAQWRIAMLKVCINVKCKQKANAECQCRMPVLNSNVDWPKSACLVRMLWILDQHAQTQHTDTNAQAQHWPWTLSCKGYLSANLLLHSHWRTWLILSMPLPTLSLSMLILATYPNLTPKYATKERPKCDPLSNFPESLNAEYAHEACCC